MSLCRQVPQKETERRRGENSKDSEREGRVDGGNEGGLETERVG